MSGTKPAVAQRRQAPLPETAVAPQQEKRRHRIVQKTTTMSIPTVAKNTIYASTAIW